MTNVTQFLTATDLDELLTIKNNLPDLSAEDKGVILQHLDNWQDTQAVANLLMYPSFIPKEKRFSAIIRGFEDTKQSYYQLATIVGLQNLPTNDFTESQIDSIKKHLFDCIGNANPIIAQRAAITIQSFIKPHDLATLIPYLTQPDETIQHNIMVILVALNGLQATKAVVEQTLSNIEPINAATVSFLEQRLAELDNLLSNEPVNKLTLLMSNFSTSRLTYIPNLTEWSTELPDV